MHNLPRTDFRIHFLRVSHERQRTGIYIYEKEKGGGQRTEMNTYDIRNKEVINIYDGRSLGFVEDVELNLEKGTIEAIIIPAERGFMGFFPKGEDLVIRWRDIKRIGDDVILVDFSGVRDGQYLYETGNGNERYE